MKVEQKMMSGSTFSHLVYGIDSLLVVTVKEINLESLDAHIAVMLHDFLHLLMTALDEIAP